MKKQRATHIVYNLWSGKEYVMKQRRWRSASYKARRALRRGKRKGSTP